MLFDLQPSYKGVALRRVVDCEPAARLAGRVATATNPTVTDPQQDDVTLWLQLLELMC